MIERPELIAYQIHPTRMQIVPGERRRAWIDATHDQFAARCLPMLISNQAGWCILNSHDLSVRWNGEQSASSMKLTYTDPGLILSAQSHFGHGILTFQIPFLFRTSPGWILQARGPANLPIFGAYPLEGIIESDWAVQTFTMNYQIEKHRPVTFPKGFPICQIVPIRRGDLESFAPEIRHIASDPEIEHDFEHWKRSRQAFNRDLKIPGSEARAAKWQKDYMRGRSPSGIAAPEQTHQTNLKLSRFMPIETESDRSTDDKRMIVNESPSGAQS